MVLDLKRIFLVENTAMQLSTEVDLSGVGADVAPDGALLVQDVRDAEAQGERLEILADGQVPEAVRIVVAGGIAPVGVMVRLRLELPAVEGLVKQSETLHKGPVIRVRSGIQAVAALLV